MEITTTEKLSSYLSFYIGDEEYAAHVNDVLNIMEVPKITKVPKAPAYMKGVIDLRGKPLPVIDTRIRFGLSATEFTDRTCIVVIDLEIDGDGIMVGILVDSVEAVYDLDENMIQPPPKLGKNEIAEFITGITRHDDSFIMILGLAKLFSKQEIKELKKNIN